MTKKKMILALTLTGALAVGASSVEVWARGGGCHRRQVSYALCEVEDCHTVGVHEHDDTYYCGHFIGDGHDYHEACSVEGCTLTCEHEHDGVICLPCDKTHTGSTAGCHSTRRRGRHCH